MATFSFRSLFTAEGRLPIVCDGDLTPFDTDAILCLDDELLKLIPSAPSVACEFEGETAFVTCGYFMRFILLDHAKFFDQGVLRSNWSRTGIKPEVWARMLRLAQSNGLSPSKDLQGTLRGLVDAFSVLDLSTELVITADDIEVFESVSDDTSWLPTSGWMEYQTFDDFVDHTTGSVAPLGFISSACGSFLDVEFLVRGGVSTNQIQQCDQNNHTNDASYDEPDDATVVVTAVVCIPSKDDWSCSRRCSSYNCAHSYK